ADDVATVKDGVITAVSAGNAVITVSAEDGTVTKEIKVVVNAKKDEISNTDETITITGDLPGNVILITNELGGNALESLSQKAMAMDANKELFKKYQIQKIYDITLQSNGVSIQPDGTIRVKIKLTKELLNKDLKIARISKDGKAEVLPTEVIGEYIVFTTDQLSTYSIISENKYIEPTPSNPTKPTTPTNPTQKDDSPNTGDRTNVVALSCIIALAGGLFIALKKSKSINGDVFK
ncbi:MAG: hypothetical protein RR252_06965, partial [Longicatena sp.]